MICDQRPALPEGGGQRQHIARQRSVAPLLTDARHERRIHPAPVRHAVCLRLQLFPQRG
jgi:hypothetical protein